MWGQLDDAKKINQILVEKLKSMVDSREEARVELVERKIQLLRTVLVLCGMGDRTSTAEGMTKVLGELNFARPFQRVLKKLKRRAMLFGAEQGAGGAGKDKVGGVASLGAALGPLGAAYMED